MGKPVKHSTTKINNNKKDLLGQVEIQRRDCMNKLLVSYKIAPPTNLIKSYFFFSNLFYENKFLLS